MTCYIDHTKVPPVFICSICEATAPLSFPITTEQLEALTQQFRKQHRRCSEPKETLWTE